MWEAAISLINLFANAPDIYEKWKEFMSKRTKSDSKFMDENEKFMFGIYREQLITRIISYDLVIAFSKEHTMPKHLVKYCREEVTTARKELEKINNINHEEHEGYEGRK